MTNAGNIIVTKQSITGHIRDIPPVPPKIPRVPLSVFISITSRCNLSCLHCAVYGKALSYGPDLTTPQWLSFIDHIAQLKVFRVKISGGEPFAREDIFTILDHLSQKPIRFSLNTNASLIDEPAARHLHTYGKRLSDIMVSLDGGSEEVHDALRGQGAFRDTIRGLGHLVERIGRISAYCTVTRLNVGRLDEVARLADEVGITGVKFNDLIFLGRGHDNQDKLGLSDDQRRETTACLNELKKTYPSISGTFLEVNDIFDRIRSECAKSAHDDDTGINYLSGCGALRTECAIRPDGYVTPCDRLTELVAGNILDTRLDTIWSKSAVFKEFRKRFVTPVADLPTCADCRYAPYSTAGCAASAFSAYGTTLARDPSCCLRLREEETPYAGR
jgi:SynChlorMet cassette radical SAM/SPASM protein ScmE